MTGVLSGAERRSTLIVGDLIEVVVRRCLPRPPAASATTAGCAAIRSPCSRRSWYIAVPALEPGLPRPGRVAAVTGSGKPHPWPPGTAPLQGRANHAYHTGPARLEIQQPARAGQVDQTIPPSPDRRADKPVTITRRPAEAPVRHAPLPPRPPSGRSGRWPPKPRLPIADLRPPGGNRYGE